MSRNLFENNEVNEAADEDFIESIAPIDMTLRVRLPPLQEGFRYETRELPSGRHAVIVVRA